MKLKAWMVYLVGLMVIIGISLFIEDQYFAGSLIGKYVFYGGIVLGLYYLPHWFVFRNNSKNQQTIAKKDK